MNTRNQHNNIIADLDRQERLAKSKRLTSQSPVRGAQSLQQKLQQLSLFDPVSERENPPPFPLQIEAIPDRDRLKPEWSCRLIHYKSGLKLSGQFTHDEAREILKTTRYWNFTVDKDRIPRCRSQLLCLLERICSDRPSSKKQEVAA